MLYEEGRPPGPDKSDAHSMTQTHSTAQPHCQVPLASLLSNSATHARDASKNRAVIYSKVATQTSDEKASAGQYVSNNCVNYLSLLLTEDVDEINETDENNLEETDHLTVVNTKPANYFFDDKIATEKSSDELSFQLQKLIEYKRLNMQQWPYVLLATDDTNVNPNEDPFSPIFIGENEKQTSECLSHNEDLKEINRTKENIYPYLCVGLANEIGNRRKKTPSIEKVRNCDTTTYDAKVVHNFTHSKTIQSAEAMPPYIVIGSRDGRVENVSREDITVCTDRTDKYT